MYRSQWSTSDRATVRLCQPFSEGLAGVRIGNKVGYIDSKGTLAIKPQFDKCEPFSEGLALVGVEQQYIDHSGKMVIDVPLVEFFRLRSFSEGLAEVERDGKVGYINRQRSLVIGAQFDYAYPFSEGLALSRSVTSGGTSTAAGVS